VERELARECMFDSIAHRYAATHVGEAMALGLCHLFSLNDHGQVFRGYARKNEGVWKQRLITTKEGAFLSLLLHHYSYHQ